MRKVFLVCIFTFMAFSLVSGQTLDNITTIAFTKQTRGFLDKLVISKDNVHGVVENHKAAEKSKHYASDIDKDEWASLVFSLKDVSLKDVDGLQSPTMNRAHDGAIHSSIVINFKGGVSISHAFDDENPHPDLQPLLNAILKFRQHDEKK